MHTQTQLDQLSRRERQIMEIVYRHGEVDAYQVQAEMDDAPSYSSVRTFLKILHEKGYLTYHKRGPRFVYAPTTPTAEAADSMIRKVVDTFFGGSLEHAMTALLKSRGRQTSDAELDQLTVLIERAKEENR